MDRPKRAAIYCRVSSAGQEDNYSLSTQEAECRAWCEQRGHSVSALFRDVWTGAEVFERPALTALRADMRAGAFDILLVHALDRLSRDTNHQGLVLSEAEHAGVEWQSVTEDIDNSPQGKIMRAVIGGMAELERLKIAERTQRGKKARVASGKYNVGCRPPYGYRWSDPLTKARLAVDTETGPVVARIFREIAGGGSARGLSLALTSEGVPTPSGRGTSWHVSTIRAIVKNPVYTGDARAFRWSKSKTRGVFRQVLRPESEHVHLAGIAPALVTPELAQAVLVRLTANKRESTRNNKTPQSSLLRGGYVRCGYCGNAMRVQHEQRGTFYRCNTSSRDQHGCPHHVIAAHIIDSAVWSRVEAVLTRPEIIGAEVKRLHETDPTRPNIAAVDKRLTEIERQRENLARRLALFDDEESAAPIVAEMQSLGAQHARLKADREGLVAERVGWERAQERLADLEFWCRRLAVNLGSLEYEQKRLALQALGAEAHVWRMDHEPRYEIRLRVDDLAPALPLSALPMGADAGLFGVHVDGYTRRGCATPDAHRADRL